MTVATIDGVPVFHWNPLRRAFVGKLGDYVKLPVRSVNFGDMITPPLVERMRSGRSTGVAGRKAGPRILGIGSILHFARDGDVVWGSGVNGKIPLTSYAARRLDVRAVRGPKTRAFLAELGIDAPEIYGDPALLLPRFMPELRTWASAPSYDLAVVPNVNDFRGIAKSPDVINPRSPLMDVLERIARSRFVVSSSLHGVVVAESLGIPARLVKPRHEHPFKYEDYYLGTGRSELNEAETFAEAIRDGVGSDPVRYDEDALVSSFPHDLWDRTEAAAGSR